MTNFLKLAPQLLSWAGIVLVLGRTFPRRKGAAGGAAAAGFAAGAIATSALFRALAGEAPFAVIKSAVGISFLLLWGIAGVALYRATGRGSGTHGDLPDRAWVSAAPGVVAGLLAGAICTSRIAGDSAGILPAMVVAAVGVGIAAALVPLERFIPSQISVAPAGAATAVTSLLLFASSSMLRLDLFSPLTMKVMKFTHDFVHQFFESMLIPDHLFFTKKTWGYIGFLFSNGVGFWGGLVIWFTPAVLILVAFRLERLPSVAHIRQGAQRRKVVAAAIAERRWRLVVPALSLVFFCAALYQSRFPTVEYWDPKPVAVEANAAGEIFIPKKGEIVLTDGKLHKYLYKQGGQEARFFILQTPAGKLTVVLDACSICKPDGYGQTEGTVICYYCKTLIPLETVGKPGGCNPVPIPFVEKDDGISLDGITLTNTWRTTVQSTARVKEAGK